MKILSNTGRIATIAFFSLAIGFTACKKEKSDTEPTPQEEEEIARFNAESESETDAAYNTVFDDVMGVNNEVGLSGTGIFGGITATSDLSGGTDNGRILQVDSVAPSCVVVSVVRLTASAPFPVRITLDFGAGCTGRDGHVRSGKIITTYSGRLIEPGKSAVTTFENYKIDSVQVEGTHTITNTSTSNMRQFTVTVQNGKLSRPSGNYAEWNSSRVITQVEGLGTPLFPHDDVFHITGNGSGTVKRGNLITRWESNIIEPLRKRFNCRWIVKGKVRVIRRGLASNSPYITVLDYGQGTCDNAATLTVNGHTHQITLR